MTNTDALRTAISEICRSDARIRIVYLHGSYAIDKQDKESDIDIAVLAEKSLDKEKRHKLRLDLIGELAEALHVPIEKMDVVIFQDVSLLLKFNAVRNGICLFERDRSERNLFVLKIEQEYDDEEYYLKRENEYTISKSLSRKPL